MREWWEEDEEEEEEITGRAGEPVKSYYSQYLTINFYLEVLKFIYQNSKLLIAFGFVF